MDALGNKEPLTECSESALRARARQGKPFDEPLDPRKVPVLEMPETPRVGDREIG